MALGPAVCTGTEPPLPPGTAEDESIVESRRDVLPSRRQVDLFISSRRLHGRHDRLSPKRHARCGCRQTFPAESIAFARSSSTEGDQRGPESVLSEGGSRTEANRRTRPMLSLQAGAVPEQYR